MSNDKRRVGIQINTGVYDKLLISADKYGMTVNSLIAYILGQWTDSNFGMKEKISEKLIQEMTKQVMDIENNPVAMKIVKDVVFDLAKSISDREVEAEEILQLGE